MAKMTLNEEQLRNIVEAATRKILGELDWRTMERARSKAQRLADNPEDFGEYDSMRRREQAKRFAKGADDQLARQYGISPEEEAEMMHYKNSIDSDSIPSNGTFKKFQKRTKDVADFHNGISEYDPETKRWESDGPRHFKF